MVRAVLALVLLTMAPVTVDVPVTTGALALPAPVLTTTVAMPAAAEAPVASSRRASPTSSVVYMEDTASAVAAAPTAPTTPVATPVELLVAPAVCPPSVHH